MRNSLLALVVIGFMTVTVTASYGQEPDKKSEKARVDLKEATIDVADAELDLKEAQKDSVSSYQSFKKESELKIKDNEKCIADLKVKSSEIDEKNKATYQKKVSELEQQNDKLQTNLSNYNDDGSGKWTTFKTEFNHDMNELGKAIKDLTVNDKI